jgi:hypothetical protein
MNTPDCPPIDASQNADPRSATPAIDVTVANRFRFLMYSTSRKTFICDGTEAQYGSVSCALRD